MTDFTRALQRTMNQQWRPWRIAALLTALLLVIGVSITATNTAQAGPQCTNSCGSAVNRSSNVGIGILYNAWSNYAYDAVIYPGQSSTRYAADIDKVWAGAGWCIDIYDSRYLPYPSATVHGPGWSGNLTDWLSPSRLYAYTCGGSSGSW